MIIANDSITNMIGSPVRKFGARVELYNGSTLTHTFSYTDALKELTVERVGDESKFFGFGVCQKLNVKLIDVERAVAVVSGDRLKVEFGVEGVYICPCPLFTVTEVHRDEKTNELSITAYDAIHDASVHTTSEINLTSYTILQYATACATLLGLPLSVGGDITDDFMLEYPQGANFEGTESIRDALNAIAEATQTIYYINSNWELTFKRLDKDGEAVYTIDKSKYITLDSKTNRRLATIVSATELGDNVSASIAQSGTTQYVRDNAFWELRDDIAELVENAVAKIGGLSIGQFNCAWRGNFLLEIGDKIALVTKDNEQQCSYVLNDTITYNGFLSETTQWSYTDNDAETHSNPTTLGEALKQTFAKVDKANKQIDLVASVTEENGEEISQLQMTTSNISASVSQTQKNTQSAISDIESDVAELENAVETKISAEELTIAVKTEIANGVSSVVTEKGYTFSDEGLRISQSGSQMESLLDENGLAVFRDGTEVLTADNTGVKAIDVKVSTYLIIGGNSRFENYGNGRTGCFWIGG